MPQFNFSPLSYGVSNDEIVDYVTKLTKQLDYLMSRLGSKNIREIGNYLVSADAITHRNGLVGMSGSVLGGSYDDIRLWAGSATPENAPFRVYNSGKTYIGPEGVYAGKVKTDQLEAGSAKIGTALIEDLIVGNNVYMGPFATISWGQVTDQPSIPELPSYIKSTYIDSTQVISPFITGGVLTGGTIQTAATGRRIVLSGSELQSLDSSTKDGFTLDGSTGYLRWYSSGSLKGGIYKNFSGVDEQLVLDHENWLGLTSKRYAGGMSRIDLQAKTIAFGADNPSDTTVNFSGCNITGLNVVPKFG